MVIEEREWRADSERVKPKRDFRQLDRHRILVYTVDHPLEHHAPHEVTIVETLCVEHPVSLFGGCQNLLSNSSDAVRHRRLVPTGLECPVNLRFRRCHPFQNRVRQIIYERHQKVTASHRRIADLEIQ